LNREREQFVIKMEEDETGAMEDYGVPMDENGSPEIVLGSTIELLVETENKDAVDEIVTQFQEKIDQEAGLKDQMMAKGCTNEWKQIAENLKESQFLRGRNIISEIIETAKAFSNSING